MRNTLLGSFVLAAFSSFVPVISSAAVFVVTSTADEVDAVPGDGACASAGAACTLRAAVQEANALSGADTITLPAGTFQFTIGGRDEELAATGDLDITDHLIINGAAANSSIIDAATLDRVLHIQAAAIDVTISAVSIANGNPGLPDGGGILNSSTGTLTINDAVVRNNAAGVSVGGGIHQFGAGTLVISNSTIRDNTTGVGGGLASGFSVPSNVTITDSVIANNTVTGAGGGLSHLQGDLLMTRVRVENNVRNGSTGSGSAGGIGLGTRATARIVDSTISGNNTNSVNFGGGGIYNQAQLTIEDSVISNNTAPLGGGLQNSQQSAAPGSGIATLRRVRIESNAGGGILNGAPNIGEPGTLTLEDTTVNANSGRAGIENTIGSALSIFRSTVSRNTGGGGVVNLFGTATLENVTISNNVRIGAGGGILAGANTTVHNVTIVENRTETDPSGDNDGGGVYLATGTLTLRNSIVANNTDADGTAPDCAHDPVLTINSAGNNLIENPAPCVFTGTTASNITGLDPMTGPLTNNGGPTETHALLMGSPAIDAGSACAATDQRGVTRPLDGDGDGTPVCDIGAFEAPVVVLPNPVPVVTTLDPPSVSAGGPAFTLTVNGTGFVSGATVQINGTARLTTFVSATQLTADILASDIATAGTASVTVVNPAPGGGTSNPATLVITALNPVPVITTLDPPSVSAGGPGFTLTVNGTGFVSGGTVQVNGSARLTTLVSSTQLTADILASDIATAGTASVTVVNPAPGGGTSNPALLAILGAQAIPTLSTITLLLLALMLSAIGLIALSRS